MPIETHLPFLTKRPHRRAGGTVWLFAAGSVAVHLVLLGFVVSVGACRSDEGQNAGEIPTSGHFYDAGEDADVTPTKQNYFDAAPAGSPPSARGADAQATPPPSSGSAPDRQGATAAARAPAGGGSHAESPTGTAASSSSAESATPANGADASRPDEHGVPSKAAPAQWTQAELEAVAAEIQKDVEELRGAKFDAPIPVKLTDKKGFLQYARARQKETDTPEKTSRDESIAKLLGFVPPDMDLEKTMLDLLEEQVGGFYDPTTKTFYLMDTFTGGVAKVIMAHELTHALDDQHYDIDGTLKKLGEDTDAMLAFQAVVEGSGTNLMTQWFKGHLSEVSAADLERAQGSMGNSLENAPPYLWLPLLAVYLRGEGFLVHTAGMNLTAKAADVKDVDTAFRSPPESSEQILHPDKYWKGAKRDDPLHVTIDTSRLPNGWKVAGEDTLGELYLGLLTTPQSERKGLSANSFAVIGVKYTNKASEGWGGDRLVLLENGDDRFLELVTAWDTQKDAEEFAAALDKDAGTIPVLDANRSSGSAFRAGATATKVEVVKAPAAEGTYPVVVVRIESFAKPQDASKLELPWHVEAKSSAQAK